MNKKVLIIAGMLVLCACGTKPEQKQGSEPSETEETAVQEEGTQEQKVIWVKEPSMKLEQVIDMESVPFVLGGAIEYEGYPAEWYKNGPADQAEVPQYRTDAVIVKKDGAFGIMDYEGNVLFPFIVENTFGADDYVPISWQPYTGFITWDQSGGAKVFSTDLTKRSFVMSGGIGGYAPMPYIIDHQILIEDLETMEVMPFTNTFGTALAVDVDNENREPVGCAVVSKDTEILFETDGFCGGIINSFLKVNERSDWTDPGKSGFVRVNDGKEITGGAAYEDTGFFEDGYAPVKKDGRWAYIDEEGTLVSDFIFDDAGVLNEGRAYVSCNGLYGILNVKKTAEAGIFINAETCGSDYSEEEMIIPELNENEVIGTVTVLIDNLNTRSIPSAAGEKKEKAVKNQTYDVYEIYSFEGYTWYRIGDSRWVADNGSWLQYAAG